MMAIRVSLITAQLIVTVPASMACFPQFQKIKAEQLEKSFHNLRCGVSGQIIKEFTYNKGL